MGYEEARREQMRSYSNSYKEAVDLESKGELTDDRCVEFAFRLYKAAAHADNEGDVELAKTLRSQARQLNHYFVLTGAHRAMIEDGLDFPQLWKRVELPPIPLPVKHPPTQTQTLTVTKETTQWNIKITTR